MRFKDVRKLLQRVITCGMAKAIIQDFEKIQIEEDQTNGRSVTFAKGDLPGEFAQKCPPVIHRQKGIEICNVAGLIKCRIKRLHSIQKILPFTHQANQHMHLIGCEVFAGPPRSR